MKIKFLPDAIQPIFSFLTLKFDNIVSIARLLRHHYRLISPASLQGMVNSKFFVNVRVTVDR